MTHTVQSADESTIAYDKTGAGPALIVIGGAFSTRQAGGDIVPLLAAHFTVYTYDRRGRGDSTEATPSAPQREIEDLAALIDAAGGSALVYGHSSGAMLALEAAASGLPISRLAAYEPPYTAATDAIGSVDVWRESVQTAVDAGDRDLAAVLFLRGTGAGDGVIDGIKQSPWWPGMLLVSHTLPYDIALLGDDSVPAERFRRIAAPTLLLCGGDSPPWAGRVTSGLAEAIPHATQLALPGQDHGAAASVLAPVLIDFFG